MVITWSAPATARRLATSLKYQQGLGEQHKRAGRTGKVRAREMGKGIFRAGSCKAELGIAGCWNLLGCDRCSGLVFLILSSVRVARDDRGDALGRGGFAS